GVEPYQVVEVMGLAGDAIDNIPGVPGVGEKTAIRLIQEFGTIDGVLKNLDDIKTARLKENLNVHIDDARLSRELATIHCDAHVDVRLEDLIVKGPDYEGLRRLFQELGFNKFLKEIPPSKMKGVEGDYRLVIDEEGFYKMVEDIKGSQGLGISVKVVGRIDPTLIGIAVSFQPRPFLPPKEMYPFVLMKERGQPHKALYIPVGHSYLGQPHQLEKAFVLEGLKSILEDEGIKKWGQDVKLLYIVLKQWGIGLKGVGVDLGVASYLLNPARAHTLEEMAHLHLDYPITPSGEGFEDLDVETATKVACEEVDVAHRLARKLLTQLEEENLLGLFSVVEMPLVEVLAEMELIGVKANRPYLEGLSKELELQLTGLEARIYRLAGEEFNISSPKQLAEVLFERLRLKPIKKTKTGYSTDEEVLTQLAVSHELPAEVLHFRHLSKLKSTYVDALIALIEEKTGRVHTSFNQTATATGRLSSRDPNLQNTPIRTEMGKRIREAFVAEDGFLLLSADYSQIELRLVAHLSQDPYLVEAFKKGEDIHTRTASEVFGLLPGTVTEEIRRKAKAINFGIIYGMGPYGLSKELGITQEEAKAYIDTYLTRYQGIKGFIDKTIAEAKEKGYTTTLMGRRRYIPELKSESESVRRLGERMAINTPIQGTAADIIKMAMVNIYRRLKEGFSSRIVLQIHDELLLEVAEGELDLVKGLVKEEMEGVVSLSVPIKVDIGVGRNWREAGE
ncbi:MAG: DNA polymerase I, partial [Deltaproteobacteria bacterium]|nr:DNA polymerase I [Deltaproteobacteria bacterium]